MSWRNDFKGDVTNVKFSLILIPYFFGYIFHASAPPPSPSPQAITPVNTIGCGDALTAGLTAALARGTGGGGSEVGANHSPRCGVVVLAKRVPRMLVGGLSSLAAGSQALASFSSSSGESPRVYGRLSQPGGRFGLLFIADSWISLAWAPRAPAPPRAGPLRRRSPWGTAAPLSTPGTSAPEPSGDPWPGHGTPNNL